MRVEAWCDGASRGNPGPAGAGAVVDGEEFYEYLGRATNNQAEYRAVILALEKARERGADEVAVTTDSNLVARQLNGDWRVNKNVELFERAKSLLGEFDDAEVQHVRRENNEEADVLANRAIDSAG